MESWSAFSFRLLRFGHLDIAVFVLFHDVSPVDPCGEHLSRVIVEPPCTPHVHGIIAGERVGQHTEQVCLHGRALHILLQRLLVIFHAKEMTLAPQVVEQTPLHKISYLPCPCHVVGDILS